MRPPAFKVRIIRTPIGEAPEWVREAWVGLELPLVELDEISVETGGVLTGPRTPLAYWWARLRGKTHRTTGYVVLSARAIELLARTRPDAADWWRTHAPRFCEPCEEFIFDSAACDPSPEPIANAPWG